MSPSSPVVLIIGAGPRVGKGVAQAFAAKGYKIALVSRKAKEEDNTADQVNISADMADPSSVASVFSKVKSSLGLPSVVIYNAAAAALNDEADPLSITLEVFARNININTVSSYAAAQQAVIAFSQLPESASKTFIYTGNMFNTVSMGPFMDLGVGKSGTAHFIQSAAAAYKDKGYKFYYGDERKADGSPGFQIDGDAHGALYTELAEGKTQGPWSQTFVKGKGYTSQFEKSA